MPPIADRGAPDRRVGGSPAAPDGRRCPRRRPAGDAGDGEPVPGIASGSARRALRKARTGGVTVQPAADQDDLRAFFDLHLHVRKHKYRLLAQPYRFMEHIWKAFVAQDRGTLLLARLDGRVIAGVMFLEWQGVLYYKFNASHAAHLESRPNDLVLWEGIRHARRRGLGSIDFGLTDAEQARAAKQAGGRVVQLGTDLLENTTVLGGGRWAVETDAGPYAFGAMFGRRAHDGRFRRCDHRARPRRHHVAPAAHGVLAVVRPAVARDRRRPDHVPLPHALRRQGVRRHGDGAPWGRTGRPTRCLFPKWYPGGVRFP